MDQSHGLCPSLYLEPVARVKSRAWPLPQRLMANSGLELWCTVRADLVFFTGFLYTRRLSLNAQSAQKCFRVSRFEKFEPFVLGAVGPPTTSVAFTLYF